MNLQDKELLENTILDLGFGRIDDLNKLNLGANSENYVVKLDNGSKVLAKYFKVRPSNPER